MADRMLHDRTLGTLVPQHSHIDICTAPQMHTCHSRPTFLKLFHANLHHKCIIAVTYQRDGCYCMPRTCTEVDGRTACSRRQRRWSEQLTVSSLRCYRAARAACLQSPPRCHRRLRTRMSPGPHLWMSTRGWRGVTLQLGSRTVSCIRCFPYMGWT